MFIINFKYLLNYSVLNSKLKLIILPTYYIVCKHVHRTYIYTNISLKTKMFKLLVKAYFTPVCIQTIIF